jgi:hypothetical protein
MAMTLRLHVAVAGVSVPLEVHHKETIEQISQRALSSLFGPDGAPPVEKCQMSLGEEVLDMNSKVHEIELQNGVHLNLTFTF